MKRILPLLLSVLLLLPLFPAAIFAESPAKNMILENQTAMDAKNVSTNDLVFEGDTVTCTKTLNTDGVTYTVTVSDKGGDGAIPDLSKNDLYTTTPWFDADVTTVIFDETITSLGTWTVVLHNKHKIKEIHFKAPQVTAAVNAVVDYSSAPGRQATVYAYSTWSFALSEKFAGLSYYEAKNFTEEYASLWTLEERDAAFYETEIGAALAAYETLPEPARAQLSEQYAKLNALGKAIGAELPAYDETLIVQGDTVRFEKLPNADGKTYTVTVSDKDGNGALPNLSALYAKMPWHDDDVTAVIFDETITALSPSTIVLDSHHKIKDIHFKAPNLSVPDKAILDNSASGKKATVHAYSTWSYALGSKFEGVSYYEAEMFADKHKELFDKTDTSRGALTDAIADYMALPQRAQAQVAAEKAVLDELAAAHSLGGKSGTVSYLIDELGGTLKLSGTGTVKPDTAWSSYKDSIVKLVIDEGITAVGTGAFQELSKLEVASLPFGLTSIAKDAFPQTEFELHGWLNHTTGDFAKANKNISLKLKELRILTIGNSHTMNYTDYFNIILGDLRSTLDTKLTHERIIHGSRRLISRDETASAGNHYDAAHGDSSHGYTYSPTTDVVKYTNAFAKTWDIVILQDYHESTMLGASFASELGRAFDWIREELPGVRVVWFADWVEDFGSAAYSYENSIAAVKAVEALASAPDDIIVASTIIENARNTYFGTTKNAEGVSSAMPNAHRLPILECDEAHMSYELGQYMLGSAVMYQILENLEHMLPLSDSFDFFGSLKTAPVHADWKGEFAPAYRDVIREIAIHSYEEPLAESASEYTVDPSASMLEELKKLLQGIPLYKPLNETALNVLFKSGSVLGKIEKLGFHVAPADIRVTYNEATREYTVDVACQYGYSAPATVSMTATAPDVLPTPSETDTEESESETSVPQEPQTPETEPLETDNSETPKNSKTWLWGVGIAAALALIGALIWLVFKKKFS